MDVQPTVESYDQLVDEAIRDEEGRPLVECVIVAAVSVAAVLYILLALQQPDSPTFVFGVGLAAVGAFGLFRLSPPGWRRVVNADARRRAAFVILVRSGADLGSRKHRRNAASLNEAIDQWREHQANSIPQDVSFEVIQSDHAPTATLGLTIDTSGRIHVTSGTPVPNPLAGGMDAE